MITGIELTNFEGFTGSFAALTGRVLVSGRNGAGKSRLMRAVCWAITGRTISGDKNPESVLGNGKPAEVRLVFSSSTQVRRGTKTTKKTWFEDGEGKKIEGEFEDPDWEFWMSHSVPGFFMGLPDADRRSLLLSLLPKADNAAVFEKTLGFPASDVDLKLEDLEADHGVALGIRRGWHQKGEQVAAYLKGLRDSPKRFDGSVMALKDHIETKEKEKSALIAEKADLEGTRRAHWDWSKDRKTHLDKKAEYEQIEERNKQRRLDLNAFLADEGKDDPRVAYKVGLTMRDQRRAKVEALESTLTAWTELADKLEAGEKCPLCGTRPAGDLKADTSAIEGPAAELKREREKFIAICDELNRLEPICKDYQAKLNSLEQEPVPEVPPHPKGKQPDFDGERLGKVEASLLDVAQEIAKAKAHIKAAEQDEKMAQEIQAKEEELEKTRAAYRKWDAIVGALAPKGPLGTAALESQEAIGIPDFRWEFTGTNRSGGEIQVCRLVRERDGVPYQYLSTGERLKVDILICELFQNLAGVTGEPVFIDNADLADGLRVRPETQAFVFRVVKNQELRVDPK
jgi:DNA repair exonuclease SbcCD ATPase subunit